MSRILLMAALAAALVAPSCAPTSVSMTLVGTYASPLGAGAEIISIQKTTHRAALASALVGQVEILDLADPAAPVGLLVVDLGLAPGEELTSVAFHPLANYFAAAIQAAGPGDSGRVELRNASTGALLNSIGVGVGPDSVVIDRLGKRAVVAGEAEDFVFDPATDTFSSPAGSISIVDLRWGPFSASAVTLPLADQTGTPGFVASADARLVERPVDVNGNGVIDSAVDLNGDGDTNDNNVTIGTFKGQTVKGKESDGELLLIPLGNATPDVMEPEGIAITHNAQTAYVTLQEVNGVAVVDLVDGAITSYIGLGTSTHAADITDNGSVSFTQSLFALREPDGIALTHPSGCFVTADEGDTDPKASKTAAGKPAGGSRTLSVFNASTGAFVADTGNQIDEQAAAAGIYPDDRSDNKGSEPETVALLRIGNVEFAVVSLERANGVALVSLADPAAPSVLSVVGGGAGPEGIAVLRGTGDDWYVYTANEVGGTVSVFHVVPSY